MCVLHVYVIHIMYVRINSECIFFIMAICVTNRCHDESPLFNRLDKITTYDE